MNQEFWVAAYAVVYALQLFIQNGRTVKKLITTKSDLKSWVLGELKNILSEMGNVWAELKQLKAVNTIIITELIDSYQARLEITNDEAEQLELLAKIKKYSELLK